MNDLYTEKFKRILNELLLFCNLSNRNYIHICGIDEDIWERLITRGVKYTCPKFGTLVKEVKNKKGEVIGVIINYEGNHIVLQKKFSSQTNLRKSV